jgi:ubiquinone/menaquinone biosynthesis C-methylase UbiE
MNTVSEQDIRDFWNGQPCGTNIVPPHDVTDDASFLGYLDEYDAFRYNREGHILTMFDRFDLRGKRVLEIGLGQGADSEHLIRRGALWSGIDLTPASIEIVGRRLRLKGLSFDRLELGSAVRMPFADHSFDYVYSFGVLHHVPDIAAAQSEIHRVLKPDGRALIMMYAKNSINYHLAIRLVRRVGLIGAIVASKVGMTLDPVTARHVALAQKQGVLNYLTFPNFLNRNTDGPDNAFSRVYDAKSLARDLPAFTVRWTEQDFLHAPPLPVAKLPMKFKRFGWHLWALLEPK